MHIWREPRQTMGRQKLGLSQSGTGPVAEALGRRQKAEKEGVQRKRYPAR